MYWKMGLRWGWVDRGGGEGGEGRVLSLEKVWIERSTGMSEREVGNGGGVGRKCRCGVWMWRREMEVGEGVRKSSWRDDC